MLNFEYKQFKGGVTIFCIFIYNLTLTRVVNFNLLEQWKF